MIRTQNRDLGEKTEVLLKILPYGTCPERTPACAHALSYWETALGFVAGLPGFPAYVFVALGLNGEPTPAFILASTPRFEAPPEPQLERTFEPVCPGASEN
jgi:hypothetical protein